MKDVAAETFLIAWRRLPEVPDDPVPWLFGVARKVIAGHLRSAERREALRTRLEATRAGQASPHEIDALMEQRAAVLTAFA